MIFRHAFFHGDPHPSNILHLEDGRLGLVDFGLAGRLTETDMVRLTRLFVDAATENVARCRAASPISACATRASGRRSFAHAWRSCTTATTGRGCPTLTRSRRSARGSP